MGRKRKIFLGSLIGLVLVAAGIAWLELPAILLYKAKRDAHQVFEPPTRDNVDTRRSLNATPTRIVLPQVSTQEHPQAVEEINSYILRFPKPTSKERRSSASLVLTYPKFTVALLPAHSISSADAYYQKLVHQTFFEHQLQVYDTRLDDVDAAPDLASLKKVLVPLTEKAAIAWPLYAYCAVFDQDGRRGFIEACDKRLKKIHFSVLFPQDNTAIGGDFINESGVFPEDVQRLIATLEVKSVSTSTTNH